MTEHDDIEFARQLWQEDVSIVARLTPDDLRMRAVTMDRQFRASRWVPWVIAAVLVVLFAVQGASSEATVQRFGAVIGSLSGVYLIAYVLFRHPQLGRFDAGATCLEAYLGQLDRQRGALKACAVAILLLTVGSTLLAMTPEMTFRQSALGAAGQALVGAATTWYVWHQASVLDRRSSELRAIETSPAQRRSSS